MRFGILAAEKVLQQESFIYFTVYFFEMCPYLAVLRTENLIFCETKQ